MKNISTALLALVIILFYSSCKETPDAVDYNPNIEAAKDYIYTEDIYVEMFNLFFKACHDTVLLNHGYNIIDNCDVQLVADGDSVHFHYGPVDRLCYDNKYRRGSFYASLDGPVFDEGVKASISTEEFYVDNALVNCTMEIKNMGLNAADKIEYTYKIFDGSITETDTSGVTTVIQFAIDYQMTWLIGDATPNDFSDDIWTITGLGNGISLLGDTYSFNILEDLYDRLDCNWIVLGVTEVNIPSAQVLYGTVDYILEDDCNYQVNFIFNDNLFYHYLKH